ncbi:MAG: PAS domain S-box protein, partial [Flavobacterium sp.]
MSTWFHFTVVWQGELLVVTTEDISEAKQSEQAIKEAVDATDRQKRLYDSLTGTTPDLLYVFDLDYKFSYANNALLQMWGKTYDEAVGRGLRENGYEEWHAQMHEREIDQVVATKKGIRGTVSFPHAELGTRIYDYILMPVLDQNGDVEAIAGTTRDITDIKRAEDKYRQSEKSLRTMIDQTPAATLVLMGDDFVISQINPSMLQLIGHGEEVVGRPLLEVMPELEGQY